MASNILNNQLISNTEERPWEYLPDFLDELSQYSTNSDLIQLSNACKNYRTQIRPVILKTLRLFKHPIKVLKDYSELSNRKEKYLAIIKDMEKYLAGNPTLGKVILFYSELPLYFYQELFRIFKDVEFVKLHRSNDTKLISILNELGNLKRVKLPIDFSSNIESDKDLYFSFLRKMETIEMYDTRGEVWTNLSTPLKLDSTFTNLKALTISNLRITSNFPTNLPSLVNVNFIKSFYLPANFTKKLLEFFNINPQLKKLTIADHLLNEEIIQSIFNLNNLKYLKIDNSNNYRVIRELNGVENRSIEHLEFTDYYQIDDYRIFLNCCINLKVVEIYTLHLCPSTSTRLVVDRLIELLIIHSYQSYIARSTFPISLLRHFSIVSFDKWDPAHRFKKTLKDLNGWKFRDDYPGKCKYYSIVRD